MPPGDRPRLSRYREKAREGEGVEVLAKTILQAIVSLAERPVVSEETVTALKKAVDNVSEIPKSLEDGGPAHSFMNYGSGPQSVHLGKGHQNINTGPGQQLNGSMGTVNLNKPGP